MSLADDGSPAPVDPSAVDAPPPPVAPVPVPEPPPPAAAANPKKVSKKRSKSVLVAPTPTIAAIPAPQDAGAGDAPPPPPLEAQSVPLAAPTPPTAPAPTLKKKASKNLKGAAAVHPPPPPPPPQQLQMPVDPPADLTAVAGSPDAGLAGATSVDSPPTPTAVPAQQPDPIDDEKLEEFVDSMFDGQSVHRVPQFAAFYLKHDCSGATDTAPRKLKTIAKSKDDVAVKVTKIVEHIMKMCVHCKEEAKKTEKDKLTALVPTLLSLNRNDRVEGFMAYYSKYHCHRTKGTDVKIEKNPEVIKALKELGDNKDKKGEARDTLRAKAKQEIIALMKSACKV